MSDARKGRILGRSLVLGLLAIFGFVFLSHIERSQTDSAARALKLAGPLAAVAQSVPQGSGAMAKIHQAPRSFSIDSLPKPARDAVITRQMRITPNGDVQVYVIVTEMNADNISQLENAGVTVQLKDEKRHIIQALVPVSRLAQVSELPFVKFVRLPTYARRRAGSVDTEGDAILQAYQARTNLGIDGTGVKVAAISDGLKGVFATGCTTCQGANPGPISTGDLPIATGTRNSAGVLNSSSGGIVGYSFDITNDDLEGIVTLPANCGFAGAGAEGTALLEIIHDIAPGAQLSFVNFTTDVEFNAAVNALAAANDVVVDDIGFLGYPDDGTSAVSTNTSNALNNSTNQIRAYVTSVGNDSDFHYRGLYTDSKIDGGALTGITGDLHEFKASPNPPTADYPATVDTLSLGPQTYNEIELPVATTTKAGGEVLIVLNWDDPFGSSTNEYDLYLVEHGTSTIVASATPASCFGPGYPCDYVSYTNDTSQTFFDIVIQNRNNSAAAKHLNLYAFSPECAQQALQTLNPAGDPNRAKINFNTRPQSIAAESDAGGGVISVAAICSGSAAALGKNPTSCNDPNHDQAEFYSSLGPTIDGRTKPDIAAIDGVSITGAGSFENPFFGTSAAAPHVAGIAALTLQAAPCLLNGGSVTNTTARSDLRNLLLNHADAVGAASPQNPDDTFGSGRINALTSAEAALPVFSGPSVVTVNGTTPNGASLTAYQLGFSDPDTCPLTKLQWSGGCGGPGTASSMSCGFGPNTLAVSASNNGLSYSSPANLTVTVTDFTMGAAPASPGSGTVTAGQSATYTVTVTSQYGPFTNAVALSCSNSPPLPPGTSCSFNPGTVTPGATAQSSTLTVSTTGSSLAPPLINPHKIRRMPWPSLVQVPRGIPMPYWLAIAALALAGVFSARFAPPVYRRQVAMVGGVSFVAAAIAIQVACGGGGSSPPPPAPVVSLSPSSLTFSTVTVGKTSAAQPATLTNSGNATLSITSIAANGDFKETDNCGSSVTAGANCTINVTFTPTAAGSRTGTLSITDNASGSPHTVSLTGTGQVPTPAGNYTIGVNGTAGSLVNSTTATLVVQ